MMETEKDHRLEVLIAKYREGEAPNKIELTYNYNMTQFSDSTFYDTVDF